MGAPRNFARRAAACVLAVAMTFSTVPRVAARDAILGTINVAGKAYSATATTDWAEITATRPVVSGDRFKTDEEATLVADFHELGIVGLYGDSEMSVVEKGEEIVIDARRGKVAFFMAPESRLKVTAGTATVIAGERKAEGYVQFTHYGPPELIVESEDVTVAVAGGTTRVFARGDRIVLGDTLSEARERVAAVDERKAGAVESTPPKRKYAGLSPLGWTAIAGAVAAVAIGAGVGLSGGGGGGGDDDNASE